MLTQHPYPILEFDDAKSAKIDPPTFVERPFDTDRLVITFFPEVLEQLKSEGKITLERSIWGENPIDIYKFTESDVIITLGVTGCPSCGGNLDLFHAMGIDRVMFCGGGGVLDKTIGVGQLLLVEGAIRDEGFSYHYLPPSRTVEADPAVTEKIARHLDACGIPYLRGITWTTDAIFRETADRIARRQEEGAKIVEMEQAGCLAVAKFRGFSYGALIYGGDDVSQEEWSNRGWQSRKGVRYNLVQLCREICEVL